MRGFDRRCKLVGRNVHVGLKEVAPSAIQYSTVCRASSASVSWCICGVNEPLPSRYAPVT